MRREDSIYSSNLFLTSIDDGKNGAVKPLPNVPESVPCPESNARSPVLVDVDKAE